MCPIRLGYVRSRGTAGSSFAACRRLYLGRTSDGGGRLGHVLSSHLVPARGRSPTVVLVYRYRVHDATGDDLGTVEHPAPRSATRLRYSSAARTPSSFIEEVRRATIPRMAAKLRIEERELEAGGLN